MHRERRERRGPLYKRGPQFPPISWFPSCCLLGVQSLKERVAGCTPRVPLEEAPSCSPEASSKHRKLSRVFHFNGGCGSMPCSGRTCELHGQQRNSGQSRKPPGILTPSPHAKKSGGMSAGVLWGTFPAFVCATPTSTCFSPSTPAAPPASEAGSSACQAPVCRCVTFTQSVPLGRTPGVPQLST